VVSAVAVEMVVGAVAVEMVINTYPLINGDGSLLSQYWHAIPLINGDGRLLSQYWHAIPLINGDGDGRLHTTISMAMAMADYDSRNIGTQLLCQIWEIISKEDGIILAQYYFLRRSFSPKV